MGGGGNWHRDFSLSIVIDFFILQFFFVANNFFNTTCCVSGDCPFSVLIFVFLLVYHFPFSSCLSSFVQDLSTEKTTLLGENHCFSTRPSNPSFQENELEGGHALVKLPADPIEKLLVAASSPYPNDTKTRWNRATAGALRDGEYQGG